MSPYVEYVMPGMRLSHFIISALSAFFTLAGCSPHYDVQVSNPLDMERTGEMAEIALSELPGLTRCSFVITDAAGTEVPYQLTHDSLIVFQANVHAHGTALYRIRKGVPAPVDTIACGACRHDRKDDLIWENDKSGYRTYGPALQADGEKAYGYDVFTKSVTFPVMKARFDSALYSKNHPSFHIDHGNGMDSYGVGPTLGCGATALVHDGKMIYPWCWTEYEIMDNGPLRFSARLKYSPVEVDGRKVVETRVITSDAGSYLNRADIRYAGLPADTAGLAVGIVVHKENPDAYRLGEDYMGYADLGDRNIGKNGEIYCGAVFPESPDSVGLVAFDPDSDGGKAAMGQIVAETMHVSGTAYSYYFGSGWSRGGVKDLDAWEKYLSEYVRKARNPLQVRISK